MLRDYIEPQERLVACPNQDVVYGFGILSLDKGRNDSRRRSRRIANHSDFVLGSRRARREASQQQGRHQGSSASYEFPPAQHSTA
jgi:hypothetical protein